MHCYWHQRERCVGYHHWQVLCLESLRNGCGQWKFEPHLTYLRCFQRYLSDISCIIPRWLYKQCELVLSGFQSHKSVCGIIFQTSFSVSFPFPTGEPFLPAEHRSCSHNQAERHPQGWVQPVHEGSESHPDSCPPPWHRVCAVPMATRGPHRRGGVRLRHAHPHALPGGEQHPALLPLSSEQLAWLSNKREMVMFLQFLKVFIQ